MTTTSYLMLSAGLLAGFILGACLWEGLIAGPYRHRSQQREWRLEDRAAMWRTLWFDHYAEHLDDHDLHSRKVANLKMVK